MVEIIEQPSSTRSRLGRIVEVLGIMRPGMEIEIACASTIALRVFARGARRNKKMPDKVRKSIWPDGRSAPVTLVTIDGETAREF